MARQTSRDSRADRRVVEPISSGALWRAEFAHIHRLRERCSGSEASFVAKLIYPLLGTTTPLHASQAIRADPALGAEIHRAWINSVGARSSKATEPGK